jgi:hypothetical protein
LEFSRLGGLSKSAAKMEASRRNLAKAKAARTAKRAARNGAPAAQSPG